MYVLEIAFFHKSIYFSNLLVLVWIAILESVIEEIACSMIIDTMPFIPVDKFHLEPNSIR